MLSGHAVRHVNGEACGREDLRAGAQKRLRLGERERSHAAAHSAERRKEGGCLAERDEAKARGRRGGKL